MFLGVATTNAELFFTDFSEDLGVVGQVLETVDQTARHGVLGSEQEGEDNHGHFAVGELLAAFVGGVAQDLEPFVQHAFSLGTVGNCSSAPRNSKFEPFHRSPTRLLSPVDLGSGNSEGEVDQFQSNSDVPVLVADFLGGLVGEVVSAEDLERSLHVEVTCGHHDFLGGGVLLGIVEPEGKVFAGDDVLDVDVHAQSTTGEEEVETATVFDMGFTSQEDPGRVWESTWLVKFKLVSAIQIGIIYTDQLSGLRIAFAECTRQGSAWLGELRILRA